MSLLKKTENVMVTTFVFDAYGTLFDVSAAARQAAQEPNRASFAQHWAKLSEIWRNKQLQYTWLRAVTGHHIDFWQVTQDGLDFALEALELSHDAGLRDRLLQLYWELQSYQEVKEVLTTLKAQGLNTAILSNGSPDMLNAAVTSAGLETTLDAVLSVEDVGVFKPDARVYEMVNRHFGTESNQVMFVSSNGWDIAGAGAFGFQTAWVNRANDPIDRLMAQPDHVLSDLTPLPNLTSS